MKKMLTFMLCAGIMNCLWSAPAKSAPAKSAPAKSAPAKSAQVKSVPVKWSKDLLTAQKSLKGSKKKFILLFFTAPGWCGPCRMLESGAVGTPAFAKIVSENAAVRVDFSNPRNVPESAKKLLQNYVVEGFPTLLVLDVNGKEKGRLVGFYPEKAFFAELKKLMK